MSIYLLESKRRSQRSLRDTVISVALHAATITLAVYATASAGVVPKVRDERLVRIYPPRPESKPRPSSPVETHPHGPRSPGAPRAPVIASPITIPDQLPPIDPSPSLAPAESLFSAGGRESGPGGLVNGAGSDSTQPLFASQVEKPALPRGDNPSPAYPSVLESSRVAGTVLAQFVVDTMGRADMRTFAILSSTNDLFAASVRSALSRWRFYPAEAGGRKVKQIVQLPLRFIAPRR